MNIGAEILALSCLVIYMLTSIKLVYNSCQQCLLQLLKCPFILLLYIFVEIYSYSLVWDARVQILHSWYLVIYLLSSTNLLSNSWQPFLLLLWKCLFVLRLCRIDRICSYCSVWDTWVQIFDSRDVIIYILTSLHLVSTSCQPFCLCY